jgi:RHS repeat-associated protein
MTASCAHGGVYLNGNRVSDVFQLKGPDGAAACYSATCTASWSYDARDRLVQEVNGTGVTTSFTLDTVGNLTGEVPSTGAATTRTYSGQQLATQTSSGTTVKFLYDAYGNQDCKVKSTYAGTTCPASGADLLEDWIYDYKNRLSGYRSYNGSGTLVTSASYVNDPLDRPVSQSTTTSGSTTNYAFRYIGATDLLSTETLTGATSATRKYAYDASGRRSTMADGANRYSYQYDPHGSVSLLLDQTGTAKASYGYSAYGNANTALTKTAAGFTAATNAYRYTGKRLDTGSTTLDMGARRYLPVTGRFLQVDYYNGALANLGLSLSPLSNNRYALAGGNPVNYVEIDGHMALYDDTVGGPCPKCTIQDAEAPIPNGSGAGGEDRDLAGYGGSRPMPPMPRPIGGVRGPTPKPSPGNIYRTTPTAKQIKAGKTPVSTDTIIYYLRGLGWSLERATSYALSFEGPTSLRVVMPGERFFRYSDGKKVTGSFLTDRPFATPEDAVNGLHLSAYGNGATRVQTVIAKKPTLVFEGGVYNGSATQQLVLNSRAFSWGPKTPTTGTPIRGSR